VWATPIDAAHIELRIAVCVKILDAAKVARPLAWMPQRVAMEIVSRMAIHSYAHDVAQDFDIWQHKQYVQPPALAEGDGPVGPYRRWCRQFYPGVADAHPDTAGHPHPEFEVLPHAESAEA
jgi:hypothetical protein